MDIGSRLQYWRPTHVLLLNRIDPELLKTVPKQNSFITVCPITVAIPRLANIVRPSQLNIKETIPTSFSQFGELKWS